MDILSQTLFSDFLDFLLKNWRAETMIGIIVFLLTYYLMNSQTKTYKRLAELYKKDVIAVTECLKTCHQTFLDIKQTLLQIKEKQDKEILLNHIERIVEEKISELQMSNRENQAP